MNLRANTFSNHVINTWNNLPAYVVNAPSVNAFKNRLNKQWHGRPSKFEGSKPEILSRIAQTTAALSRLKIICKDKNISLASKVKLMRTLILSTFLYACESWTLTAEIERWIQALEMRCYRRLLNISYKDHMANEEVRNRIQNATGVHVDLLTMVKKRKRR